MGCAQGNDRGTISTRIDNATFGLANCHFGITEVGTCVGALRAAPRSGQIRIEAAIGGAERGREKRLVGVMCRRIGMDGMVPVDRLDATSDRACDRRRGDPAQQGATRHCCRATARR
jgi:hypothetical protein